MVKTMLTSKFEEFRIHYWERWLRIPFKYVIWEVGFHAVGSILWWSYVCAIFIRCLEVIKRLL